MSFIVTYVLMDESGFKSPHVFAKNYSFIFNPMEYISTLTFTNNFTANQIASNAVLWSLPFEVWFYVLAAVIMTRNLISILLAFSFILLLQDVNIKTLFYASIWFTSFFASFIVFDKNKNNNLYRILHAALIFMFAYFVYQNNFSLIKPNHSLNLYCSIGVVMIFFVCYAIRMNISLNLFEKSSEFSYTLYLTHFPILFFVMYLSWYFDLKGLYSVVILSILAPILCILFAKFSASFCENKRWVSDLVGVKMSEVKDGITERF